MAWLGQYCITPTLTRKGEGKEEWLLWTMPSNVMDNTISLKYRINQPAIPM